MSIEAYKMVWAIPDLNPSERLVLLALADFGVTSWPSAATVARMVGLGDRHVRRITSELAAAGIIKKTFVPGRSTRYTILPTPDTHVRGTPDTHAPHDTHVTTTPDTHVRGTPDTHDRTPDTHDRTPDTGVIRTVYNRKRTIREEDIYLSDSVQNLRRELTKTVSQTLFSGNEVQFNDTAFALDENGATVADVEAFGVWWAREYRTAMQSGNGKKRPYPSSRRPSLELLIRHWRDYKDGHEFNPQVKNKGVSQTMNTIQQMILEESMINV